MMKMITFKSVGRLIAAILVVGTSPVWADVKMPAIFGDHMVLQQDSTLPVWGTAESGEKVTVTVGSSTASATAGTDGKWMVKLKPLPAGTAPLTMTVVGKNSLKFDDVLVGDVWICSGQSNMEFGLGNAHNATEEIPKANNPLLRLFLVPKKIALTPQDDISAPTPNTLEGHWVICTPDNVIKIGGWKGFSAAGYFFGRELQMHLNRPIGLIGTYWGGTPAQSWTSLEVLAKEPALKHYANDHDKSAATYTDEAQKDFDAKMAAYNPLKAKWEAEVNTPYKNTALKEWNDAAAKAAAAGQPPPPKPNPPTPAPVMPVPPTGGSHGPANLYNGMIAPLIPYAIKGAIWYQGESNAGAAVEYRTLFADMITDWRTRWSQGDFPFLFVQLAKYQTLNGGFAELRMSQFETLALPNTGMASAVDVGDVNDIHPKDKLDVGHRLALAAQHIAYGENLVYSGPLFDKAEIAENKVTVSFTQVGGGLVIGSSPWIPPGATPIPTTSLVGFTITGDGTKWVPADATINGNTVVVSSPQVAHPIAVRYAFETATGNLYNKEGLPASPFRSDKGAEAPPAPAPAATTPPPVTK